MLDSLVQVSVDSLAGASDVEDVRLELLEASLEYYQEFIEQAHDNPPLQSALAAAHLRVAKILHAVGSTPAAKEAFRKALEMQEKLVRENPGDFGLRRTLFSMYQDQGILSGHLHAALLGKDEVQRHLQMTEDQVAAMEAVLEQQREARRRPNFWRDVDVVEMRTTYQQHTEARRKAIGEILDDTQRQRLEQIVLQRRGTHAFSDDLVSSQLRLTAEQRVRISMIQNEPPPDHRKEGRWDFYSFGDRHRRIWELLTDEQKDKWVEMTGEPFWEDLKWGPGPRFRPRPK
jgi:hypothetical protein